MIGDDLVGLLASSAQRPFEERLSRLTVTVIAEEYVEYLPVLVKALYKWRFSLLRTKKTSSTYRLPPGRRWCFRASAASSRPKVWTQRNTVRLDTSTPRSVEAS